MLMASGEAAAAGPAAAVASTTRFRIALNDRPPGSALALLDAAGPLPFPVGIRVESSATDPLVLDQRLATLEGRGLQVWLALPAPATPEAVDAWRAMLRRLLDRHGEALSVLEIDVDRQAAAVARFAVQTAATEAGAARGAMRMALGGAAILDQGRLSELYTADLAPYVDLLVAPAERQLSLEAWLPTVDPQGGLALLPPAGVATGDTAFLQATLEQLGTDTQMRAWNPADLTASGLHALAFLPVLLTHDVTRVDDKGASLVILRNGTDALATLGHVLLFDLETFATYFAYWGDDSEAALLVSLSIPIGGTPRVYDLTTGSRTAVPNGAAAGATSDGGLVQVGLPVNRHVMVVDFNDGATLLSDRSDTSAERVLSVNEIVARHQRQQRIQDNLIENYVAHARMEQHFRPTMADPGYDVVAENTYFSATDGVEWEERSFSVNGSRWGSDRPPFPLLQPEKVLALPLLLRFDEGYRYRLMGTERVRGFDCYAVKFEPVRDDSALYRGTVWIDRRTFAKIRVQAVQSGLSPPVISNDETHEYAVATTIGNQPIFLLTNLAARQILLVAGRNLLVEKRVGFTDIHVNDPDFATKREIARESAAVMFRDTPQGLRYYVKENGRRVVMDRPTKDLKALAMGVTLDPSYGFPLPIFGINYLNFNFGNPDSQLAILFAGVLAAGNIQRSHFGAKSVDASIDFFAIAAPSSDRVYGAQGEDPAVRLLTWPMSTGLNLGWQATAFQKATFQYQFRFDGYIRDRTTSETFEPPSSTVTNGFGGAWEYRRGGYSFVSNGAWYRRASWKAWGEGQQNVTAPSYLKYSAALSRDFYLDAFQKVHLNGSWFGSHNVDRFGTYQFGMFEDTRVHGVPASGVRFAEVGMARGSYSVNIFDQYRVDLFFEHAWGRDVAGQGTWQKIPALGLAVNLRAPWNTILRIDAGKSHLPDRYRHLGSATLQVMLLKPLK